MLSFLTVRSSGRMGETNATKSATAKMSFALTFCLASRKSKCVIARRNIHPIIASRFHELKAAASSHCSVTR